MADVEEMKWKFSDDQHELCVCGHFAMNHANYMNMPSGCNQTHCGCNKWERAKLPADASPSEPQEQDEPKCPICKRSWDDPAEDSIERLLVCGMSFHDSPPAAPTAAGSEEPKPVSYDEHERECLKIIFPVSLLDLRDLLLDDTSGRIDVIDLVK